MVRGVLSCRPARRWHLPRPGRRIPATAAGLYNPEGIAVDAAGDLFIADTLNNRIREVNHATGVITTVAGSGRGPGFGGFGGDNFPATTAELNVHRNRG